MSRKTTRKQRQDMFCLSAIIKQDKEISALQKENAILRAQLAEARNDSERLDFMAKNGLTLHEDCLFGGSDIFVFCESFEDGVNINGHGKTSREAIDNAMKGGE